MEKFLDGLMGIGRRLWRSIGCGPAQFFLRAVSQVTGRGRGCDEIPKTQGLDRAARLPDTSCPIASITCGR